MPQKLTQTELITAAKKVIPLLPVNEEGRPIYIGKGGVCVTTNPCGFRGYGRTCYTNDGHDHLCPIELALRAA